MTFIAFDFGVKRTGIAAGNRITRSAQPVTTLKTQNGDFWTAIEAQLKEWQPDAIVIGVPFHPDGAPHKNTNKARGFGQQLKARFRLPVFEVDERYSTCAALELGAKDPDAAAACIILEQYLRDLP